MLIRKHIDNWYMKILRKIRNYFCYCGLERDEYHDVKKSAYISNFEIWRILHLMMSVIFLALSIASFINDFMGMNKWFYVGAFAYSLVATLLFFLIKKKDALWPQFVIYLSISVLFLFGCFITSNKPDVPAITFIAFLVITPMFMIDRPFFMSLELIIAATVYLVWMYFIKEPAVFKMDIANIIIFTFVGIFIHIIANSIRIKEFMLIKIINTQKDTDELTGLKNKAALTREIGEFVERSDENKGLFFVLDINYFKQINDTYGHDEGDIILNKLGKYFKEKFDGGEIVGRFGGDEFIIFIKDTDDAEYAKKIALEVCQEVEDAITLPNGKDYLTISIGVAIYQGQEKHYSDIFKKADMALYKTKDNRSIKYSIYK